MSKKLQGKTTVIIKFKPAIRRCLIRNRTGQAALVGFSSKMGAMFRHRAKKKIRNINAFMCAFYYWREIIMHS